MGRDGKGRVGHQVARKNKNGTTYVGKAGEKGSPERDSTKLTIIIHPKKMPRD